MKEIQYPVVTCGEGMVETIQFITTTKNSITIELNRFGLKCSTERITGFPRMLLRTAEGELYKKTAETGACHVITCRGS